MKQDGCFQFREMFSWQNIFNMSFICQRGVKWKRKVQVYIIKRCANSIRLSNEILGHTYKKTPHMSFVLNERGKKRQISGVSSFEDRIVMRILSEKFFIPLLGKEFILDNTASQLGKGTEFARQRFKKHMQKAYNKWRNNACVVLYDFKNYFASINSSLAISLIEKKIYKLPLTKDDILNVKQIIDLSKQFILEEKGLGLGNQTSQDVAVWFASRLDHYINEVLHCGLSGRYMDDGYIFCDGFLNAYKILRSINDKAISIELKINSEKCKVLPVYQCICFLKTKYIIEGAYVSSYVCRRSVSYFLKHYKSVKNYCIKNQCHHISEILQNCLIAFKGLCGRSDYGIALFGSIYYKEEHFTQLL